MKQDIPFPTVEGVYVAIAKDIDGEETSLWKAYLINSNSHNIQTITIRTKGYGHAADGTLQETSILRFFIDSVAGKSFEFIELIDTSLFHLNNEYWVSYFLDNQVYDKKFIFVPDSILEQNTIYVPILELKGVLHK